MIDAFGKPGTNLKNYQLKWLGSYDECVVIKAQDYYPTPHGWEAAPAAFEGKYCLVSVKLEQGQLVCRPK